MRNKPFAEWALRRCVARDDSVKMRFFARHFFHRDRADAGSFVNFYQLLGGGIFAGDQHIAEQHRERFVAYQILCHQHRVAQSQRLFLPRVADLHHVADVAAPSPLDPCLPFSSRNRSSVGL